MDQELLDQQAAIYRVEGVDENAPAAPNKKKRKQNGDEVRAAAVALSRCI